MDNILLTTKLTYIELEYEYLNGTVEVAQSWQQHYLRLPSLLEPDATEARSNQAREMIQRLLS